MFIKKHRFIQINVNLYKKYKILSKFQHCVVTTTEYYNHFGWFGQKNK